MLRVKKQIEDVKMDMHQTNKGTSKRNKQTSYNQEVMKQNNEILVEVATRDVESALAFLETTPNGISEKEAERRIDTHGRNEVAHEKPPAWYLQLLLSFKNPFIFVLLALGVLSFFTDDMKGTIVVTVMVVLSAFIRFLQEFRSQQAAEKLKAMVRTTATVLRTKEFTNNMDKKVDINNNQTLELPIEDLVPGDIIKLSAGDIVPADVRILSAKDLFVNQGALTGEALPVEKYENYHHSNIKKFHSWL
ncbi:hypothetical protein VK90_01870 [Bacillus sp. LK2]|nr:hypothetical protein VK90_01870 [Bacillus sp. LK2]